MRLEDVWMIDVFDLVVKKNRNKIDGLSLSNKHHWTWFLLFVFGCSPEISRVQKNPLVKGSVTFHALFLNMRSFRGSVSSAVVWWICRASQRNGRNGFVCCSCTSWLSVLFCIFGNWSKTFQKNQKDMRIIGLHSTFWIRNSSCFDLFFCGKWICWWHQVADLSSVVVSGGLWWGIHRVPLWRGRAIEDWCWRRSLSAKDFARGEVQRQGWRWEREQQIAEKARGMNSWY